MVSFHNIERKGNVMHLDISGINTSIANALRRTILMHIPNVGFSHDDGENHDTNVEHCDISDKERPRVSIDIQKNTTSLHNEYISHRVSMLPLRRDAFKKNVSLERYLFGLQVSEETHTLVTTDDFKVSYINEVHDTIPLDPKHFFVRNEITNDASIITRFSKIHNSKDAQEIRLICTPKHGTHKDGAGFSPVSVCSMYENDDMTYHIMFETLGSVSCDEVLRDAIVYLVQKCESLMHDLENDRVQIEKSGTSYRALDFHFDKECHTMGNMIFEWIYQHAFNPNTVSKINHVSYHEPHPLSNKVILRLALSEENESLDEHKKLSKGIVIDSLKTLQEKLVSITTALSLVSK